MRIENDGTDGGQDLFVDRVNGRQNIALEAIGNAEVEDVGVEVNPLATGKSRENALGSPVSPNRKTSEEGISPVDHQTVHQVMKDY